MYLTVGFILAMTLLAYTVVFFIRYYFVQKPVPGTLEWIDMRMTKYKFSLPFTRHPAERSDIYAMSAVTVLYAIVAFTYLGSFSAPQTFYSFSSGDAVTIDMGQLMDVAGVDYYTGLYHDNRGYALRFSTDGQEWYSQDKLHQEYSETFRWIRAEFEHVIQARYIRLSMEHRPEYGSLELGELAIRVIDHSGKEHVLTGDVFSFSPEAAYTLFDEQETVPDKPNALNSTYFDEIYHARTAYEHVTGVYPYETTHPPLGKLIIGIGIRKFQMTPFGWRCMGTLFGVLMLPLFFMLVHYMFGKRLISVCATLIFAFDFMHFVQTRIATIDVYGVFFIICMYFFMYRYITSGSDAPLEKTLPDLILCGLSFGIGIAAKWISAYAGIGLLLIYVIYLYQRFCMYRREGKSFGGFLIKTLLISFISFILVPGIIYVACYIPYVEASGNALTLENIWKVFIQNQLSMLKYHGKDVVNATHGFSSRWYQWLFDLRPILYYVEYEEAYKASISAFSSPLTAWAGLAAVVVCAIEFFKRKDFIPMFILVGYLSQLLPWVGIARITFSYHYFPSLVFCVLAIAYIFNRLIERNLNRKREVLVFTAISLALFVMFYPVLAGIRVPSWYPRQILQWFVTWSV